MKFTSAEYINQVKFKHFRTYSFQRKGDYDLLNGLTEKIRSGNEFTPEEKSIYENLKTERDNLYTNKILNESNTLNRTAELVATVSDESEYYSTLIEILQTEIEEEMLWMCAPIYRDAILFYDFDNNLINGINICFECDRIESIKGEHIATDFKTFKYLKQLLLRMGHQIENPDTFKADELLKIIEQNKKKQ